MAAWQILRLLPRRSVLYTLVLICTGVLVSWGLVEWLLVTDMSEAHRLFEQGNYPQAVALAEQFLSKHPSSQDAMLLLARSNGQLGRWADAEAYFGQVTIRQKDDLYLRARGLIARRLWSDAAEVYEQILQRWPMDGRTLEQLARIRIQQGRDEEALLLAKRLVRIPSYEVAGYLVAGTVEFHHNSYARAVEALEEVVRRSPDLKAIPSDPGTVLEMLAESLLVVGRAADAEQYALQARELSQSAESCWILGMARQHQGDNEGARQYWEETVARDPNNVQAIRELGRDSLVRENPAEALQWLLRSQEIAPNDRGTLQALIATYRRLGQDEEARKLSETLKSLQEP